MELRARILLGLVVMPSKPRRTSTAQGPLLSVQQAAVYLGVRPGTLRNWLSARRIAYVKVGRLTRLSADTLNQFIAEHTVGSIEHREP